MTRTSATPGEEVTSSGGSGEDILYHFAAHIRQPEIAPGVTVGEFLMIKAEQVQHRGVQIVDVNRILDGAIAEFVGRAVNVSAFHPAAREPDREAIMIMVAALAFARRAR